MNQGQGMSSPSEPAPGSITERIDDAFVVVPAYNEAGVIREVVDVLCTRFRNVVVVNDGSRDETGEMLRKTGATVLTHAVNLGQGAALQTGISYALLKRAEYIITFDADGQHRIEDALAMLEEIRKGHCDVMCGSRFLGHTENMPASRRLLLKLAVLFGNLTTRTRLTDAHNGLRVLSRKAAATLDIMQSGMAHASEIIERLAHAGLVLREWPVTIKYTEYSLRKGQSAGNAINILIDLAVGKFLK